MIFLVLLGKIMFLFLENMVLTLSGKWKTIFFKKIQGNMIFSSDPPKRRSFQKGPGRVMIYLVLSGKMVFFSRKHDIFLLGRKPAMTLPKKYMEIWYFLCTRVGVKNLVLRPPCQKNQGWPYPAKMHLKVVDVLDWHPGKSPSNSLYLHRDLYGHFHVLLSSEKNQETEYIALKIDFFFNLFGWRYSTKNNLHQIPCTIQPPEAVFVGVLVRQ